MYIKIEVSDEFTTREMEIELGDNIYTKCPHCTKKKFKKGEKS